MSYINNPKKFTNDGADGTLIARGEVLCQYSTEDNPSSIRDWTSEFDVSMICKWIRISFDKGLTFPFQYKLNSNELSFSFTIENASFIDSGNSDYPKKYTYEITNAELFNEIRYKPIGIFIEENNGNVSTSVLAPVVYRITNNRYYLDILVTELFITNNTGKICMVKN